MIFYSRQYTLTSTNVHSQIQYNCALISLLQITAEHFQKTKTLCNLAYITLFEKSLLWQVSDGTYSHIFVIATRVSYRTKYLPLGNMW